MLEAALYKGCFRVHVRLPTGSLACRPCWCVLAYGQLGLRAIYWNACMPTGSLAYGPIGMRACLWAAWLTGPYWNACMPTGSTAAVAGIAARWQHAAYGLLIMRAYGQQEPTGCTRAYGLFKRLPTGSTSTWADSCWMLACPRAACF